VILNGSRPSRRIGVEEDAIGVDGTEFVVIVTEGCDNGLQTVVVSDTNEEK
jgi:hypothetical protein